MYSYIRVRDQRRIQAPFRRESLQLVGAAWPYRIPNTFSLFISLVYICLVVSERSGCVITFNVMHVCLSFSALERCRAPFTWSRFAEGPSSGDISHNSDMTLRLRTNE